MIKGAGVLTLMKPLQVVSCVSSIVGLHLDHLLAHFCGVKHLRYFLGLFHAIFLVLRHGMSQYFVTYSWSSLIFLSNGVTGPWAFRLVVRIVAALLVLFF